MHKYYVESGQLKKVIFAADANAAALWLVNIVMEKLYPQAANSEMDSDPFALLEHCLMLLDDEIRVSRQGFGLPLEADPEPDWFETIEVFTEWNELVRAVAKMEKMLLGQSGMKLCELAG